MPDDGAGIPIRPEITTPEELDNESLLERSLRPSSLSEFIGQSKVKESLNVYMEAANGSWLDSREDTYGERLAIAADARIGHDLPLAPLHRQVDDRYQRGVDRAGVE